MKNLYCLALLIFAFGTFAVNAQETCAPLVEKAVATIAELCEATGRNNACYGNFMVEADAYPEVHEFVFSNEGDIESLLEIASIRTQGLDVATDIWGIAVLKIQANIPDTLPGQNVTMILLGEVVVDNVATPLIELPVIATGNVNVRTLPRSDRDNIIAGLTRDQETIANGRLADNSWIRIKVPQDRRGVGWVSAEFLRLEGEINQLNVVEPGELEFGPMQAFYFSTGVGATECNTAPEDGILIQTPKGLGSIVLQANSAEITLGSTAFLRADDGYMHIYLLEGYSVVRANGVNQALPAGTFTRIPLDENGLSAGSPEAPQPYDLNTLETLPLSLLPETITISQPLLPEQVDTAVQQAEAISSGTIARNGIYVSETISVVGNCGPNPNQIFTFTFEFVDNALLLNGYPIPQIAPGVYDEGLSGMVSRLTVLSPTQIEQFSENYDAAGNPFCQMTKIYTLQE